MDATRSPPGSDAELARFAELQASLAIQYERIFPDRLAPRTIVVVPSLSFDQDVLSGISGVQHYEERLLCMLMLLRLPRAELVYLSSLPLGPWIVDYYLHLLPGIPSSHARKRLHLLSCHDASNEPLTEKILARPRLIERIASCIDDPGSAHMTCFTATELERTLAVRLGIPIYACDPALAELGTKGGSREMFREAGIDTPDGVEGLRDEGDVVEALAALRCKKPSLRRAVIKLDEGTSGEGNAIFSYDGCPEERSGIGRWIRRRFDDLRFGRAGDSWDHYAAKLSDMGGIVEELVEGEARRSPSVQCRIDPTGEIDLISTHEQILGGPCGQRFLGSIFPAPAAYRLEIQEAGRKVAEVLRDRGALGRFGIDFVSVPEGDGWRHYALEINLRKGGTTHGFIMLQYLTDGEYLPDSGEFRTPSGEKRCYWSTDNLQRSEYRGLLPEDLIDIAVDHEIHFHGATQEGVVFHLIGALSEFGKLGVVAVAETREGAKELADRTIAILDEETGASPVPLREDETRPADLLRRTS